MFSESEEPVQYDEPKTDQAGREARGKSISVAKGTAAAFGAGFGAMLAYEFIKSIVAPHLTLWESHWATICVSSSMAAAGAFKILQLKKRLLDQGRQDDMERADVLVRLDQSEARLRAISANSPCLIFQMERSHNADLKFLYLSEACVSVLGIAVEDCLGSASRLTRSIHRDHMPSFELTLDDSANLLHEWQWEGRIVTPEGVKKWVQVQAQPEKTEQKSVVWNGILVDCTERKLAEQALLRAHHDLEAIVDERTEEIRRTNSFLRNVIDTAPNLIFVKDRQGRFTLANSALADIYGTTVDGIIGKSDADMNDNADEVEYFERMDRDIIDSQSVVSIPEEKVTDACGRVHWLKTEKRALINADGTSDFLLGIATDITEIKETVRALGDAEAQYRSIFEHASEGIFQTTPEGHYLRVNPELARIYGYMSAEELVLTVTGIQSNLYVDPKRRQQFIEAVVQSGSITGFVSQVRRKDGSIIWISENARAVTDQNGEVAYYEGTVLDINDRRLAEDRVHALNSMLEANLLELQQAYDATIEGWAHVLDLRDKETEGHSRRVTAMTMRLAQEYNLDEQKLSEMRRGALLHDIGKMGIPDSILLKPGALTDEEWVTMKLHPVYANDLLSAVEFLRPSLEIPYSHHERWDGAGYPQGLAGDDIPLSARLFAVVDVWDALSSDRPYRSAWPQDRVLDHIRSGAGTHFDPDIVEIFLRIMNSEQADNRTLLAA